MSKEVIVVEGEEKVVREDTAKAYRGVKWLTYSLIGIILLTIVFLFSGLFTNSVSDTEPKNGVVLEDKDPR